MAQLFLSLNVCQNEFTVPGSGSDKLIGTIDLNRDWLVLAGVQTDDLAIKVGVRTSTDGKVTGVDDVDATEVDGSLGRVWRWLVSVPTGTTTGDYWVVAYIDENFETEDGQTVKASKVSYMARAVVFK